jgi:hypothetical protein
MSNQLDRHQVRLILLTLHECLEETPTTNWKVRGNLSWLIKTMTTAAASSVTLET